MKVFVGIPILLLCCFVKLKDAKMILKKLEQCDNKDYPLSVNVTTYFENDKQFIDGKATFKIPLSADLKVTFRVDLVVRGKLIHVMSASERNACNSIHKYLGEFAYDLERTSGLVPGLCPIPKGKYRVNHYQLDFDKVTIKGFPLGALRTTSRVIDKNNNCVSCLVAEGDNV